MTTLPISVSTFARRKSQEITIGKLLLGGSHPLRLQSMTTTDTNNISASVEQCEAIIASGGDLVRLTTQGVREAENMKLIRTKLNELKHDQPIVADVHFNAKVAFIAAEFCDKVRINPGNFIDPIKTFAQIEYTHAEYEAELSKIKDRFIPFLERCKTFNTAIRIGVNHGSLSDRIMSKFGDTAEGMVESCMEYLRIAVKNSFSNIVISIKASNTRIMVQTVRLLVHQMNIENMHFPLHLGVTEAGEGEDGRIKSAVGIGALLADGIGDTIRVSLSEDPEKEIPVCQVIKEHFQEYSSDIHFQEIKTLSYSYYSYKPRKSVGFCGIGGGNKPVIGIGVDEESVYVTGSSPEWIYHIKKNSITNVDSGKEYPLEEPSKASQATPGFIKCTIEELSIEFAAKIQDQPKCLVAVTKTKNVFTELRAFILLMDQLGIKCPVLIMQEVEMLDDDSKVKISCDLGGVFIDGLADGLLLYSKKEKSDRLTNFGLSLLQATRARFSKTEYISCPGCGRTLFNLQETIAKVKNATSHLKALKIAVMGCIVNGPGEMADADFGYVGAGKGRVSLYKGKECVKKGILEDDAIPELIELLKEYDCWEDPKN